MSCRVGASSFGIHDRYMDGWPSERFNNPLAWRSCVGIFRSDVGGAECRTHRRVALECCQGFDLLTLIGSLARGQNFVSSDETHLFNSELAGVWKHIRHGRGSQGCHQANPEYLREFGRFAARRFLLALFPNNWIIRASNDWIDRVLCSAWKM